MVRLPSEDRWMDREVKKKEYERLTVLSQRVRVWCGSV